MPVANPMIDLGAVDEESGHVNAIIDTSRGSRNKFKYDETNLIFNTPREILDARRENLCIPDLSHTLNLCEWFEGDETSLQFLKRDARIPALQLVCHYPRLCTSQELLASAGSKDHQLKSGHDAGPCVVVAGVTADFYYSSHIFNRRL